MTPFAKLLSKYFKTLNLETNRIGIFCVRLFGWVIVDPILKSLKNILEAQVEEHKSTFDEDNPRDMMDLFLNEIKKTSDTESSFFQERGHFAMMNGFIDLFIAGMETTSSSLLWTFLYMVHHPEIKQKVHQELDQVN